jgi:thioredoxin
MFSVNKPPPQQKCQGVAKDASEAAAMEAAKAFIQEAKKIVDEITELSQFNTKVMGADRPVILDCYADWCSPCRKLKPMLEKAAQDNEGKLYLVKINIDNFPQLATALNVKSVPAVFLVHRGNVIDTFNGIPSSARLREFIDTALLLESMGHDERVMTTLMEKAQEFAERGEWEPAEKMYLEGSKHEAW